MHPRFPEPPCTFVLDPWAPQSSMRVLPIPYNQLPCAPPPKRPASSPAAPKSAAPSPPASKPAEKAGPKTNESPGAARAGEKPGSGIKKYAPGTILPIEKNKSDQVAALPPSTSLLPKSDEVGFGVRPSHQGERNGLADQDPTRGGGPGKAGHAPLTGLERIAYELSLAAAMVNGQFNEDLRRPGSTPHGIVGGKDLDGPDAAIIQAAVSFTQIASGVVVAQAAKFAQRLKKAFVVPEKIVVNGVDDVTVETAEALAKQYGVEIAEALAKNGTIGPYDVMKKFTDKLGGAYQAHHIFEAAKIKKFMIGADPNKFPAVILTLDEHKRITKRLAQETLQGIKTMEQQWAAYQRVYVDHPDWLEVIKPYFQGK